MVKSRTGCLPILLFFLVVFIFLIFFTEQKPKRKQSQPVKPPKTEEQIIQEQKQIAEENQKVKQFMEWVVSSTRAKKVIDNRPFSIIIEVSPLESNPQAMADFYAKAFYNQTGKSMVIRVNNNIKQYRSIYFFFRQYLKKRKTQD